MRDGTRSAVTIAVLLAVLLAGAAWGWSAVTSPFPGKASAPTCVDTTVRAGDKIYPQQVVVSVYNAGTRAGLAGRTMQLLTEAGFGEGDSGNAPHNAHVDTAEIWTSSPHSPAVRLVASRLGRGTKVVRHHAPGAGVVVVVGDGFTRLVKGRPWVAAKSDGTICSPPGG